MTPSPRNPTARHDGTARHEVPEIDAAALAAARWADRLLAATEAVGADRWRRFLAPIPDRLRDEPPAVLQATALRARAAYGPKDSIRDALPDELTLPFRDAIDVLLRTLAVHERQS
ncbi:MAG: hypothetical protein ACYDCI_09945 [Candidatus Limnocylindrales bacterium]